MMKTKYLNEIIKKWDTFYKNQKVNESDAFIYLDYVKKLVKKGLPPIFDFAHLCLLLGINNIELSKMVNGSEYYYHSFEIPKKSGGVREITAPYESLKYVQTWIYENILRNIKIHYCAHGFIDNHSILTNAIVHQNSKCLLKMDIKDFFPSIKINWVIQTFKDFGYEHQVAYYLAALCCYNGVLPQGSPASPSLSNIIAKHLDRRLYRLAKKFNLNYSRYADDIAFSGDVISTKFIEYVKAIVENSGFLINEKKIRLYREHGNKILAGVSLATGKPRLPRDYRRNLEKELFYIDKFGLDNHIAHNKIKKINYLESILGKISYWRMIEPNNAFVEEIQKKLRIEYLKKLNIQL